MLMMDYFQFEYKKYNAGVLATDISTTVLETAMKGVYSEESTKSLPPHLVNSYFRKYQKDMLVIEDKIKKDVLFRRYNLMTKEPPFKQKFHVIFCRNVMIYFDHKTKMELVKRLDSLLVPGGYLFIGHSETIGKDYPSLEFIIPAVYKKR